MMTPLYAAICACTRPGQDVMIVTRLVPERGEITAVTAARDEPGSVATIAGAVAIGLGEFPRISHRPVAIRTIDPRSHVQAAVTLNGRTWGTELRLTLRSVPPGEHCSLVARARDGRSDTAATWVATYQGSADVPGTTAIPIDQLSEVDIVTSDGRRLARLVVPNQAR